MNYIDHPALHEPNAESVLFSVSVRPISAARFIRWMYGFADVPSPSTPECPWSREEERAIFLQFNFARMKAAHSPAWADRARALKTQIVEANLGLVAMMVSKYLPMDGDRDGTISEAQAALCRAVDKFDLRRNNKFSTYAVAAIFRALARYHRTVSRRLERVMSGYNPDLDRPIERDTQEEALELLRLVYERTELSDVERQIIQYRFFSKPTKTLEEIGAILGRSRERVRQIEARALAKLRESFEAT